MRHFAPYSFLFNYFRIYSNELLHTYSLLTLRKTYSVIFRSIFASISSCFRIFQIIKFLYNSFLREALGPQLSYAKTCCRKLLLSAGLWIFLLAVLSCSNRALELSNMHPFVPSVFLIVYALPITFTKA